MRVPIWKISIILIPIMAVLCSSLHAEEVPAKVVPLTFEIFCQKVLAYYPKLKSQESSVELAIARKFQAVAGYLPHLQGIASMTTSNDQVYVFGTLLRQRAFTEQDFELQRLNNPASRTNYNIGLHGEMPIFDALQTAYKVKSAKYMVESAKYDEQFSRMEAILVATDAYLHAVETEKLLSITEEACNNSEEDIRQAEDLKQKGMILGADFYAAKVTFGNLKNMRNDLIAKKAMISALLNILMGEDPLKPVIISEDFPKIKDALGSLDSWLEEAYGQRPDLKSIEEAIRAKDADYARERVSALPRISAFGDLNENTQNFNTGGGSFAVGLMGSIDFAPDYPARVRISREAVIKLKHERDGVKDAISKEVTGEYARFEAVLANLPVLKEMQSDSSEAVNLTLPLYREGRKSIADLLDMRRAYIETNRYYYGAIAGSGVSWANLLFLSGQLDESRISDILKKGE